MASNKESMVIIIDVGIGAEELTKKATECCLDVIKKKIFNHKVDMLSFLLLRTEQTDNVGNSEESDQYLNISQVLPGSQVATWYMTKELVNSMGRPKSKSGDWVDALIVAIGIITEDAALHKSRLSKIVLFHNFDSQPSSLDDAIIAKLNEMNFQFIIVSNNVHYVPDSEGKLHPQFKDIFGKSPSQAKNEKLVMQLLADYPSTTICNFNDALPIILRKELQRPWTWNSTLTIGSRIVIQISGVIVIRKDEVPKFQKKTKAPNEFIIREKKYYSGVDELDTNIKDDLITAYMLGNTPVPYDPSLGQAAQADTKKGIHFIGFVLADNIPQEYFYGQSTYLVLPQKGKRVSSKMMDSLVRAMLEENMSILAWKVYSDKNNPKLVVLLPTLEHSVAGLSMIELSYHSQQRFWDFPKLATKKNQPTPEQLSAVDDLMAAMELSPKPDCDDDKMPCESLTPGHLPFEFLPDILQQHLMDYLSSVILNESDDRPSKNYVKVPDALQAKASVAAEKVKALFSLKKSEVPTKDKLKKLFNDAVDQEGGAPNDAAPSNAALDEEFKLTHVGTVTPAEDFTALISNIMNRMPNGAERAAKFHQYACQMRSVISDLLFKSMTKQYEKIEKALVTYRKLTVAANSSYDYNDWMRDIRIKVIERKMFDFWQSVIVQKKLGLCMEDDTEAEEAFYNISTAIAAATNVDTRIEDDESVEDLFGNM